VRSRSPIRRSCAVAILILGLTAGGVRAQTPTPATAPVPSCFGAAARDQLHPCHDAALSLQVVPTPRAARAAPNAPCNSFLREGFVNECAFGVIAPQATRTVALAGDSHAGHWRGPLNTVARELGWRGLSITRRGCPYSTATKLTPEPTRSHCVRWVKALPGFFRAHPEIDTLFVVGLAGGRVAVAPGRTTLQTKIDGYRRAWAALPASVRHIVVIHDTPRIKRATVACIDHAISQRTAAGLACARRRTQALSTDPAVIAAQRVGSPRLQVVDLTHVLCSLRLCFPVIGGVLVYKDLHHLSLAFADTLAPQLAREIRRLSRSW